MLVLAVDTSTPVVTAGVVQVLHPHEILAAASAAPSPVTLLAQRTVTNAFGHAEHLMPLIHAALSAAGASLADLEAVVVGLGPGPFTGLRVGIATAQALGDARSLPVHGVPSHDGVALALPDADPRWADDLGSAFLVATDARRREVYVSGYRGGVRRAGPLVAAPADVAGLLPADLDPAWVTGAGAEMLAPVLGLPLRVDAGSAGGGPSGGPADGGSADGGLPVSAGLVRAALRPLVTGVVPGPLTPLYLRRPDATVPGAPKPVLPAGGTR